MFSYISKILFLKSRENSRVLFIIGFGFLSDQLILSFTNIFLLTGILFFMVLCSKETRVTEAHLGLRYTSEMVLFAKTVNG